MKNEYFLQTVVKGAMQNKVVKIKYMDSKGIVTERETEPYEIKGDMYWGYCLNKGGIRQFHAKNILEATVTNKSYSPRWPVKID